MIRLVRVQMRQGRDCVWISGAIHVRNRRGCDRIRVCTWTWCSREIDVGVVLGTKACPSCGVCRKSMDVIIVCVQLGPFDSFVCKADRSHQST